MLGAHWRGPAPPGLSPADAAQLRLREMESRVSKLELACSATELRPAPAATSVVRDNAHGHDGGARREREDSQGGQGGVRGTAPVANLTGALQVLARKTADPGAFVARVSESSKRVGASAELVGVVLLRRETGWPPRAELEARVRADAGFQALPGDRKTMVLARLDLAVWRALAAFVEAIPDATSDQVEAFIGVSLKSIIAYCKSAPSPSGEDLMLDQARWTENWERSEGAPLRAALVEPHLSEDQRRRWAEGQRRWADIKYWVDFEKIVSALSGNQ